VVSPVFGLCSIDMWSQHTQLPPNDATWNGCVDDGDVPREAAYGRGEAERMIAVGVMLIVDPLVSSRAPKC
jgi:hypothetical protein